MLTRKTRMAEMMSRLTKKAKPVSEFLKETKLVAGEVADDISKAIANTDTAKRLVENDVYKKATSFWNPELKLAEEKKKMLDQKELEEVRDYTVYDCMERGCSIEQNYQP